MLNFISCLLGCLIGNIIYDILFYKYVEKMLDEDFEKRWLE